MNSKELAESILGLDEALRAFRRFLLDRQPARHAVPAGSRPAGRGTARGFFNFFEGGWRGFLVELFDHIKRIF